MDKKYVLTKEDLLKITNGVERIEVQDGFFVFRRFTLEEEKFYQGRYYMKSAKVFYMPRTLATSGVKIEFLTDSKFLSLKGKMCYSLIRNFYCADIYVNGKLKRSITNIKSEEDVVREVYNGENVFSLSDFDEKIELGNGKKTVEIYFPWSVEMKISELALEEGAKIEPIRKDKFILFYGDSITQGYDCIHPGTHYTHRVSENKNASFINKAVGGETFYPDLVVKNKKEPDAVFVAYGSNDTIRKEKGEFKENCQKFFGNLRKIYKDKPIFAITPTCRTYLEGELELLKFDIDFARKTIAEVCKGIPGVSIIDGGKILRNDKSLFFDRRLHPSESGSNEYAENVILALTDNLND